MKGSDDWWETLKSVMVGGRGEEEQDEQERRAEDGHTAKSREGWDDGTTS